MLGVQREGGGFEKLVWENVEDTLPGGVIVDLTGYTVPADGNIPAGTAIGRQANGIGKVVADPTGTLKPLGYTIRTTKAGPNCMVEIGISGTIREKALPTGQGTLAQRQAALPRITHV